MRIGIVASASPPGVKRESEMSTELLARILARAGCHVSVLAGSNAERRESTDGVEIHRIPPPNIYWDLDAKRGLVQLDPFKKLIWHLKENTNALGRERVSEFITDYNP